MEPIEQLSIIKEESSNEDNVGVFPKVAQSMDTRKEEFDSTDENIPLNKELSDEANFQANLKPSLTIPTVTSVQLVTVKMEVAEESTRTFHETDAAVLRIMGLESPPSCSGSIRKHQSLMNSLEYYDPISRVFKKAKIEPIESNLPIVVENFEFSRANQ